MIRHEHWWFPDAEEMLPRAMIKMNVRVGRDGEEGGPRLTWQHHKYVAARDLLSGDRRRVALDIGAHVGLWSYFMAQDFQRVHAFEPIRAHRACWHLNVTAVAATVHACALGDHSGYVEMFTPPGHSGGTSVVVDGAAGGDVDLLTLDSFNLTHVDLIKIDVEGYEHWVIGGGKETILRNKPVMIVEQLEDQTPAVDLLRGLGAEVHTRLGNDYIMRFPE